MAVIAVDVWKTTPFMALLHAGGAAAGAAGGVRGRAPGRAGPVRTFFSVTLPILRGPLMVAVIFRMLDALRVFDLFFVLTNNSADAMSMAVYARQRMVEFREMG